MDGSAAAGCQELSDSTCRVLDGGRAVSANVADHVIEAEGVAPGPANA
jgi:hypothetical protein